MYCFIFAIILSISKEVGPVLLTPSLVENLRVGDKVNLVVGRFKDNWRILESGNVYPEGTI